MATSTIAPRCCSVILGITASIARTGPITSVSKALYQYFSLPMPPLAELSGISTSTPSSASTAQSSQALYSSARRTLTGLPTTRVP